MTDRPDRQSLAGEILAHDPEPAVLGLRVSFLWGAAVGALAVLAAQAWWGVIS